MENAIKRKRIIYAAIIFVGIFILIYFIKNPLVPKLTGELEIRDTYGNVLMTIDDVKSAEIVPWKTSNNQESYLINAIFTEEGTKKCSDITTAMQGETLSVYLCDVWLSESLIQGPITSGVMQLGSFDSYEEAEYYLRFIRYSPSESDIGGVEISSSEDTQSTDEGYSEDTLNFDENADYMENSLYAEYSYIGNFGELGLAVACRDGYYGYIDEEGNEKIPFAYEEAEDFDDELQLAVVEIGNGYGVIDTEGDFILKPMYYNIHFEQGFIFARDGEYGLFNANGEQIIECSYADFCIIDNYIYAEIPSSWNYNYELFDMNGNSMFGSGVFENAVRMGLPKNGRSWVVYEADDGYSDVCKLLDSNFNLINNKMYTDVTDFNQGYAVVQEYVVIDEDEYLENDYWDYDHYKIINENGEDVLELPETDISCPEYQSVNEYFVFYQDESYEKYYLFDRTTGVTCEYGTIL